MSSFVEEFIMTVARGINEFDSTIEKITNVLSRTLSDDEDVDIEEFIQMYNTRLYNIESKRADIKFMKKNDFEGVYILYNATKNFYYSGHSGKVMRKIERYYNGYENPKVHNELKLGNKFFVRIKRFDATDYSSINDLEKELCLIYDEKVKNEDDKRQRELKKIQKQKEKEQIRIQEQIEKKNHRKEKRKQFLKTYRKRVLVITVFSIIFSLLFCLYEEYKKYVPIGLNANEMNGLPCNKVAISLIEKGFDNISYYPIYDLEIESMEKENTVSKIMVDDVINFDKESKFHIDSQVVIEYHALKELSLGLSSNEIIGENYNEIYKMLKNMGFVNIKCIPMNDLIVGWLHSENEIKSIIIDGLDKFTSSDRFRIDAEIIIKYHSFN